MKHARFTMGLLGNFQRAEVGFQLVDGEGQVGVGNIGFTYHLHNAVWISGVEIIKIIAFEVIYLHITVQIDRKAVICLAAVLNNVEAFDIFVGGKLKFRWTMAIGQTGEVFITVFEGNHIIAENVKIGDNRIHNAGA